jgi:hypothetical protein
VETLEYKHILRLSLLSDTEEGSISFIEYEKTKV